MVSNNLCVFVCVHVHACVRACTCLCTCMYVCTHMCVVCVYMGAHVYVYIYTYVCTLIPLLFLFPTIINTAVRIFQVMIYKTGEYQECYRDFLCLILLWPPLNYSVPFSIVTVSKLAAIWLMYMGDE